MRVFLTGATGFIGSQIIPHLLAAGHQVLGLTRSDSGARQLEQAGAQVHRGDLEDPATLAAGAEKADAVIHCAFDHDFSRFADNIAKDRRNILAMGEALKGSDRPFLISSGVGMGSNGPGQAATEDVFNRDNPNQRRMSEVTGEELLHQGISYAAVRLPQVHDTVKQGLISPMIQIARTRGSMAYVGKGQNRWSAAHISDVARLYALALDKHHAGARWHAVAEEGVTARDIAETIAAGMGIPAISVAPEDMAAHFGPFAHFVTLDMPASSAITRQKLGWTPTGPGLLEDLRNMNYAALG